MGKDRKKIDKRQKKKSPKEDVQQNVNVVVDSGSFSEGHYDAANPLLLPSKKRKKTDDEERERALRKIQGPQKILSKKQRKKLQQIVDRREKKQGRAELLEELQKYQLPAESLQKLTPLVQVQTEGLKKLLSQIQKDKDEEDERNKRRDEADSDEDGDMLTSHQNGSAIAAAPPPSKKLLPPKSSIKGANKKKNQEKFRSWSRRFSGGVKAVDNKKDDHKVLGFEQDSSSEDDEMEADEIAEPTLKTEPDDQDSDADADDVQIVPDNVKGTGTETVDLTGKENEDKVSSRKRGHSKEEGAVKVKAEKKTFVPVNRTPEIENVRRKLPIIPEEQVIMESITDNLVTVLAGETGSGKTTQVPQFLYEAGYALNGKMIGITEPRRVAAIAMSSRVGKELNLKGEVSYQIRFEGNVSQKTKIKFMTDGVLLKEMERDFLLTKYSVICVDEAHERSLYTDLLIGLLSRCVLIRKKRGDPLKLVIMSATMRVEDFVGNSSLFKSPPQLIHVPTRQFKVDVHFSKKTPDNYLLAAYKKAVQIHKKLPEGGILIFLTGQQEVRTLVKRLQKVFPSSSRPSTEDEEEPQSAKKGKRHKTISSGQQVQLRTFDLDKLKAVPLMAEEEEEEDEERESDQEEEDDEWGDLSLQGPQQPLHVLPLYSMLPNKEQQKVFEPPPPGTRLCIVATNVAETSLTIPSIRYVVDTGKVKGKVWDKLTGVQQFQISWESKASAEQRAGRAGRTGPGHCYRLYSSAIFQDEFPAYSKPEIQVRPVDDMMLLMKSMGIDRVQNFPYPSPPAKDQLLAAEKTLLNLGALENKAKQRTSSTTRMDKSLSIECDKTQITELGKTMSHFPIGPRFSKMLALSFHHSLTEYAIALVSALTVQEVFLDASLHDTSKNMKSEWIKIRRKWAGSGASFLLGDCMVLLKAVGAFEYSGGSSEFCLRNGLRMKAMMEIRKLRKQLTSEVNLLVSSGEEIPLSPHMSPPTQEQALLLRQIILSGLPDRIARKILDAEIKDGEDPKIYKHAYRCGELEDPVFIHASSVIRSSLPNWIVYQEIFESGGKLYLRGVSVIEPEWIATFCTSSCRFEEPLTDPSPFYEKEKGKVLCHVKATYGKQGWTLPITIREYPLVLHKFKLFSQFLLEGEVFSKLAEFRSHLLSSPITMTKHWAKLQPRTQTLLSALTQNGIADKEALQKKWEEDKKFLLKEYLEWIPQDFHSQVVKIWPPLN